MNKTNIEWIKNPDFTGIPARDSKGRFQYQGYTWNPITGCLNHDNGLCKGGGFPCYAYKLAHGRLMKRYCEGTQLARTERSNYSPDRENQYDDPFYPRFWEERLKGLRHRKQKLMDGEPKPLGIFVCDMGDLFGIGIPEEWTRRIMGAIWDNDEYDRFYLLTKQPQNLIKFSPFPENCWVGVTVCNADMYLPAMEALGRIDANVRYISFEPLLENPSEFCEQWSEGLGATLDWLIIGACTGSAKDIDQLCDRNPDLEVRLQTVGNKFVALPKIEWVQQIVEAADRVGIPVFLKDNLKPLFEQTYGRDIHSYYYHNGLRQEMPETAGNCLKESERSEK